LPGVAPELKPVYLLSGSDRPKVEEALRRLRARVGEAAVEWKAADAAAVAGYLRDPAPETVLALAGAGLKRDSALAKACAKSGELLFYEVARSKLPAWVAQRFADLGVTADRDACRLLVELVGENVLELDTEIQKLATWAAEETVNTAAVEALAAGRAEASIFGLTDAWGARDAGGALAAAAATLERAAGARSGDITRITAQLATHVKRVRRSKALAAAGATPRQVASELKRNPYYVEKLLAQAGNYSAGELDDALVRLAELDQALKGGSRLPPELELDRALVETTRPRAPSSAGSRRDA
jgi:DNA polymerase-3 subunit delta